MKKFTFFFLVSLFIFNSIAPAQEKVIVDRLQGLDQYMEQILSDWNAPGIGVGIVYKDKLIFSKGYGYRDYDKKLPVTENTLFQIASNTKLFTATAVGLLVEEGKLEWDRPVKSFVPSIEFYSDELNNNVTIHDMLSHRTGISRHDMIWYKSDFTRKELFEKLVYLEPSQPLRQGFIYNNLMYTASGYIIELITKKTWEEYIKEKIFQPLGMNNTVFSISEMLKQPDYFVPYSEKRDTTILFRIPYGEEGPSVGPAGSIVSNINDLSKWLITQMNGGKYNGKQIIPEDVISATLSPATPENNSADLGKGYLELINPVYGMGRDVASYRGHVITYHGGALDGIFSQISFMPYDSIGVIVFTIGDHTRPLHNTITFNIYERLLGLDETPWSQRRLTDRIKGKETGKEGRSRAGTDRITGTKPSHPLEDYTGQFENAAYGTLNISIQNGNLQFDFHNIVLPLSHYHYDRFDTPNDELYGKWSVNYLTNPQGDIDKIIMSVDEGEVAFTRKVDVSMSDPAVLAKYLGGYESAGTIIKVVLKNDNKLVLLMPGYPDYELIPVKKDKFRLKQFSDMLVLFIKEDGVIKAIDLADPSGVYRYTKK